MSTRGSSTDKLRRRPFRSGRLVDAPAAVPTRQLVPEVTVTRVSGRTRSRRDGQFESELDRSTYNCGCGFVFSAPVLTTVACPHCGDSQAW